MHVWSERGREGGMAHDWSERGKEGWVHDFSETGRGRQTCVVKEKKNKHTNNNNKTHMHRGFSYFLPQLRDYKNASAFYIMHCCCHKLLTKKERGHLTKMVTQLDRECNKWVGCQEY